MSVTEAKWMNNKRPYVLILDNSTTAVVNNTPFIIFNFQPLFFVLHLLHLARGAVRSWLFLHRDTSASDTEQPGFEPATLRFPAAPPYSTVAREQICSPAVGSSTHLGNSRVTSCAALWSLRRCAVFISSLGLGDRDRFLTD